MLADIYKPSLLVLAPLFSWVIPIPEVKLKVYKKLLGVTKAEYTRKAIIEGCAPFTDKVFLKVAWDDPDEECKKAAREVVGNLKQIVGVK